AGALGIPRLMTAMLYEVRPTDPLVFGGVTVALMAVAVAASVVPSVRISRIRPAKGLRYERSNHSLSSGNYWRSQEACPSRVPRKTGLLIPSRIGGAVYRSKLRP